MNDTTFMPASALQLIDQAAEQAMLGSAPRRKYVKPTRGRATLGQIDTPPATVLDIVYFKGLGMSNAEVARQTGCNVDTVARIMSGRSYGHITGIARKPKAQGQRQGAAA